MPGQVGSLQFVAVFVLAAVSVARVCLYSVSSCTAVWDKYDCEVQKLGRRTTVGNSGRSDFATAFDAVDEYEKSVQNPSINGTCIDSAASDNSTGPVFSWQKRAPLVVLLGVQKGGSKALHAFLAEHPWIADHQPPAKETHFFDTERTFKWEQVLRNSSGIPRRENQLRYATTRYSRQNESLSRDSRRFSFDDTPRYLLFSDRVPSALFCVTPWVKLIALLRDPVDRLVSHFNMRTVSGRFTVNTTWDDFLGSDMRLLRETGVVQNWTEVDFDSWSGSDRETAAWGRYLRHFSSRYQELPVGRCLYALQIEHYLSAMDHAGKPRSDLLVLRSEDMRTDTQRVFNRVLDFLDLPRYRLDSSRVLLHSTVPGKPLPDRWRRTLEDFFEPYNRRLFKLLHWDASIWNNEAKQRQG